mgnify:CR=1 FL=1
MYDFVLRVVNRDRMNCANAQEQKSDGNTNVSKVYMFKEISPENLVKIYEALGREATGKVAVKLSTGEPGGHNSCNRL